MKKKENEMSTDVRANIDKRSCKNARLSSEFSATVTSENDELAPGVSSGARGATAGLSSLAAEAPALSDSPALTTSLAFAPRPPPS